MIERAQLRAFAKVAFANLMTARHRIHAALQEQGDIEIAAEIAVAQKEIAGLEGVEHGPEHGVLAGLLAGVRTVGGIEDRAGRQAEEDHHAQNGKADAGLLTLALRIGALVGGGVRHRDGGAVAEPDPASLETPFRRRAFAEGMTRFTREPSQ